MMLHLKLHLLTLLEIHTACKLTFSFYRSSNFRLYGQKPESRLETPDASKFESSIINTMTAKILDMMKKLSTWGINCKKLQLGKQSPLSTGGTPPVYMLKMSIVPSPINCVPRDKTPLIKCYAVIKNRRTLKYTYFVVLKLS